MTFFRLRGSKPVPPSDPPKPDPLAFSGVWPPFPPLKPSSDDGRDGWQPGEWRYVDKLPKGAKVGIDMAHVDPRGGMDDHLRATIQSLRNENARLIKEGKFKDLQRWTALDDCETLRKRFVEMKMQRNAVQELLHTKCSQNDNQAETIRVMLAEIDEVRTQLRAADKCDELQARVEELEGVLGDFPTIASGNAALIKRIKLWLPRKRAALAATEQEGSDE